MFNKLKTEGNAYLFTSTKNFTPVYDLSEEAINVFEFAYGMTFGNEGKHRHHRSGGQTNRRNGELFINTFQGKLAEYGVYKYFTANGIETNEPDLGMWDEGLWDDTDLEVNSKKINIKSAAHFSNLLLLETKDWNEEGVYIPNIGKGTGVYDYFILTRLEPDGKRILKAEKLFYSDQVDKNKLKGMILIHKWKFDFAGYITLDQLKYLIKNRFILPQNSMLNGRTQMDAENYYCQAGDMPQLEILLKELK